MRTLSPPIPYPPGICIDVITDWGKGEYSLEGQSLDIFTAVCAVVHFSIDNQMNMSFVDSSKCERGAGALNHVVAWTPNMGRNQTPAACPFAPLAGMGLNGWGNYDVKLPEGSYVGFTDAGYFFSPIKYVDWTITLCGQAGAAIVPASSPPAVELRILPQSVMCGTAAAEGCCVWVWVNPTVPAGYLAYGGTTPTACPTNQSSSGVVALFPWSNGDPDPAIKPTPHATWTGTPTGTPSASHTGTPSPSHTGTPSPSRTPSGTPSSSVTGTPSPSHTGTPSSSHTPSPSHTGTPSCSVTGTPSFTTTPSGTPAATGSSSASPSGTGSPPSAPSAPLPTGAWVSIGIGGVVALAFGASLTVSYRRHRLAGRAGAAAPREDQVGLLSPAGAYLY